jgi:CPA2 family monovalent cation:H+ antiporter-2
MTDALLSESLVVILASACGVALLTRVGLPAPLGYLLAGLVIGPHGLQLVAASDETRFLAELGVIFLMFMVGLEVSLPTMIAARTDVFGAGSLQVGLTSLIVAGGAMLAGVDWRAAILLGGAVPMSSTAIALKQLADQGEISSHMVGSPWESSCSRILPPFRSSSSLVRGSKAVNQTSWEFCVSSLSPPSSSAPPP